MAKKGKRKRILFGYTGSFIGGWHANLKMAVIKGKLKKRPNDKKLKQELKKLQEYQKGNITPVYTTPKKYKKLKEWEEMQYLSGYD